MVDKSEKFRWLVRLGYAARGLVYTLLGYIFLTGASNSGDGGAGSVFSWVQDIPAGSVVLYLCALGLLAYALYRFCSLFFDIENYGSDGKGWAHRIGHGASGVAHLALAWSAFQFASGSGGGSGDTAQQAAGGVLATEFGVAILGLIGLGFLLAAVAQAKKAITGEFMRRISPRAPDFTEYLGRAGYAARTVVFGVIGWSLFNAAFLASSGEIKTLGDAVNSLRDDGMWFTLVAIGLLLFGLFSLVLARYRIVPDLDVRGKVPSFRA